MKLKSIINAKANKKAPISHPPLLGIKVIESPTGTPSRARKNNID